jgi:hypothetical protein
MEPRPGVSCGGSKRSPFHRSASRIRDRRHELTRVDRIHDQDGGILHNTCVTTQKHALVEHRTLKRWGTAAQAPDQRVCLALYKAKVGGSRPSAPTRKAISVGLGPMDLVCARVGLERSTTGSDPEPTHLPKGCAGLCLVEDRRGSRCGLAALHCPAGSGLDHQSETTRAHRCPESERRPTSPT